MQPEPQANPTTDTDDDKTELALAIEQTERKLHSFDVRGFFGLGNQSIPEAAIWVSRKNEEMAACEAAHVRLEDMTEKAKSDDDMLLDSKAVEIIVRAFRHPTRKAPDGTPYPLFPGPDWAHKNFTTDQIATCLNLYNEVRKKEGPQLWTIDDELIEAMANRCYEHVDDEIPEAVLATCPREWMTQGFILLSYKLMSERKVRDELLENAETATARADRMQATVDAATELAAATSGRDVVDTQRLAELVQGVVSAANNLATIEEALVASDPQTAAELVATLTDPQDTAAAHGPDAGEESTKDDHGEGGD